MYGYERSGSSWGSIIGIIIVAVIVFLITREFWCWYWKINRLTKLFEEQNKLLNKIFFKMIGIKVDYIVRNDSINLRSEPKPDSSIVKTVKGGTYLSLLEKGEDSWIKIQSEHNEIGWCLSGEVEEV